MKFENLITLIDAVSESKLTRFRYEDEGVKIELGKKEGKVQVVSAEETETETEKTIVQPEDRKQEGNFVKSPLVGTFYAAPSEGAKPFVVVGDTVKKGQTLAIVEAMKLMNEIESEYDGTVVEVLVENGQPVEYGQSLFRIK